MKPVQRVGLLQEILHPKAVTTIVDIGANPFNGAPPYAMFRRSGHCRIIGFEPQPDALAALNAAKRDCETYLPYAVGSGATETLYLTKNSGLVSTLRPEDWVGDYLNPWWRQATRIEGEVQMDTHRLDDIAEIDRIDMLKIDIQGGELKVFQHGRQKLAKAAVVQTEVAFLPYYQGQPSFGDIQSEMAAQGFIAHKLAEVSPHVLGYPRDLAPGLTLPKSQVTVMDVIFLRDPIHMDRLNDDLLAHMALLADAVLGSFDLVLRCLAELLRRDLIQRPDLDRYSATLR